MSRGRLPLPLAFAALLVSPNLPSPPRSPAAALARDVRGLCAAMPPGLVWETAQRLPSILATAALSAVLQGGTPM